MTTACQLKIWMLTYSVRNFSFTDRSGRPNLTGCNVTTLMRAALIILHTHHCITMSYQVNARPKQICGLTFTPYDEAEPDATNLTDVVCANATALQQHQF